jgi:hypothetical protein
MGDDMKFGLGLDGHLGALARLLALNAAFEGEGLGTGEGDDNNRPPKRRASSRDGDDDDDEGFDDPVENSRGNRWRQPSAYEIQLRKETAKYRKRAQQAKDDADAALAEQKAAHDAAVAALKAEHQAALTAAKTEGETSLANLKKESDQRYVNFHIKSALAAAKCQNVEDALKLIDGSAIKITDAGDVEGIEGLVDQLKKDKAYLFAAEVSDTTSKAPKPKPGEPADKTAADMTPEEYEAARAAYTGSTVRRRRSA